MRKPIYAICLLGGFLALTPALQTQASGGGSEGDGVAPVNNKTVNKECGACHLAFQPPFLPSQSWEKIMSGLSDHFGEDATLSEASRQEILDYYLKRSRPLGAKAKTPPLRITETQSWLAEHEGEVSAAQWKKAGSKANCTACHTEAAKGIYEDE